MQKEIYKAVLQGGKDVNMTLICGCSDAVTLSRCEAGCGRYYSCQNAAVANDILAEYEQDTSK